MPNLDVAFGLRPYKKNGQGANTQGQTAYKIQTASAAGTSSVLYHGAPVIPLATGLIGPVGAANGGTVPLLGVFAGCEYIDLTGKPRWSQSWPGTAAVKANTEAVAYVWDDPSQLFVINADAAIADDAVFANANFATATSGNAVTGISTAELAVSTVATTAALNMRIVGFDDNPDGNDASAAGRRVVVRLNVHHNAPNSTTGI
jgi:hypothetical protein